MPSPLLFGLDLQFAFAELASPLCRERQSYVPAAMEWGESEADDATAHG